MSDTLVGKTCTPARAASCRLTRQERSASQRKFRIGRCATRPVRSSTLPVQELWRGAQLRAKVGELAEAEAHHPDISFGVGYAKVALADEEDQRPARERFHHGLPRWIDSWIKRAPDRRWGTRERAPARRLTARSARRSSIKRLR